MQKTDRMLPTFRRLVLGSRTSFRLVRGFANLDNSELLRLKQQYIHKNQELYEQAKQITSERSSPAENFEDILNDVATD